MDTETLSSHVKQLIALHKEREETVKELIRLTLRFLPGSKEYVKVSLSRDPHQQRKYAETRKQLVQELETYVNGDNHVKS